MPFAPWTGSHAVPSSAGARGRHGPFVAPAAPCPRLRGLPLPVQLRAAPGPWFTWRAARPAWTPAHTWRSAACVRNIAWTAVSARKVSAGDARRQRSGERCPEAPPAACAWRDGRLAAWASALSHAEGERQLGALQGHWGQGPDRRATRAADPPTYTQQCHLPAHHTRGQTSSCLACGSEPGSRSL